MNKYCIYLHLIDGEVIYVGKGRSYRPFEQNRRNEKWIRAVNESGYFDVEIVSWHETDSEARLEEAKLIRKFTPTCNDHQTSGYTTSNAQKMASSLANIGKVLSKETKIKISKKMKGVVPHNKGKVTSDDQILKLRQAHRKKAKPVVCLTIDKSFDSTKHAAKELDIPASTLRAHLANKLSHAKGMVFAYG